MIGAHLVDALVSQLIEREAFLIQITLQPGISHRPPAHGHRSTQRHCAACRGPIPFGQQAADPKIQGFSFYYVADAESRLLPGMSVLAALPVGASLSGVVVPASAMRVVGRSCVGPIYARGSEKSSNAMPIPTDLPATDAGAIVVPVAVFPRSP